MKRHQQILIAVLVLQIILAVVTLWPRTTTTTAEAQLLFPDMAPADIVSLTLVDDQQNQVSLVKDDAVWVLADADAYPVREGAMDTLLEQLLALDNASLATETKSSHEQLQVSAANFVRRIDFVTHAGKTHSVYLGSAPRYAATHFRVEGQNKTYLTLGLRVWELNAQPRDWVDTAYASVDVESVSEIDLQNAQGTFTLVNSGGEWSLEGLANDETASVNNINAVVRNLTAITLDRPLGKTELPAYGFDAPLATATLKTSTGLVEVQVGAQYEDGGYVLRSSGSPYYVVVSDVNVSALVDYARADFLEAEAAPGN